MIFRRLALIAAVVMLIAPGQERLAQLAQNASQTPVTEPLPFVSPIFGGNMVLQRGKPDVIWGWSEPGDTGDRKWYSAEARIEGNSVIVSSPSVPHPQEVRYAWQSNPPATLFNGAGLPAGPFRTDHWPLITEGARPY